MKIRLLLLAISLIWVSCKKDPVVYENNDIPDYNGISTLKVENYVNRLFIDLIGREPLDTEMIEEVDYLEANGLSKSSRETLVLRLTEDQSPLPNDTTYQNAFHWNIYEKTKARFLEGASDEYLNNERGIFLFNALSDSLAGNLTGYNENKNQADKISRVIQSRVELMNDEVTIDEMYRRMMFNAVYDEINMNSFNFVNATFDDLYYRFPTEAEFEQAYQVIEFNEPAVLFGEVVDNKLDYLDALTQNNEFNTGLVQWSYVALLGRTPSTNESYDAILSYLENEKINDIFNTILISDEYAGFD